MKRSTSYLATASAILVVPSTWTSSKEKFLCSDISSKLLTSVCQAGILRWVCPPHQVVNNVRVPDGLLNRLGVPEIVFLGVDEQSVLKESENPLARTMKATLPKSPVTLRWRLAISSLYGMTT